MSLPIWGDLSADEKSDFATMLLCAVTEAKLGGSTQDYSILNSLYGQFGVASGTQTAWDTMLSGAATRAAAAGYGSLRLWFDALYPELSTWVR